MDYDNKLPIYQQIIDNILQAIAVGKLQPGERIAPVREMAAQFKVNPNTMQRSLARLEEMGYLFTERTTGRFVSHDTGLIASLKVRLPEQITERYVEEMRLQGVLDVLVYLQQYLERDSVKVRENG